MTVKTRGIWEEAVITEELKSIINQEADILKSQGKTDAVAQKLYNTPVPGQSTIDRTWDTTQTAEQWIIFIYSLSVPPISYTIVSE